MPPEADTQAAETTDAQPLPSEHTEAFDAPTTTAEDDVQAKLIAALDEMEDDTPSEPVTPATDAAGDVDPAPTQALTGRETPETDPQDKGQQPGKGDKIDPQDLERAREAMQRVLTKEGLEELNLSDEQILARGSKIAKQQADQQKVYNEKQQLQEQVDEIVQQRVAEILKERQDDPPKPGGDPQPSSNELAQLVEDSLKEVFDNSDAYLDDDVKSVMGSALNKLAATLDQRYEQRLGSVAEQQAQTLNALNLQKDRLEMREVSLDPGFQKEYPDIRNPEVFDRVQKVVYRLAQSDQDRSEYFDQAGNPRFDRLMRDAASLVTTRNNPSKQAQVDIARRGRDASNSQPMPGTSHGQPASPEMTEEATRHALIAKLDEMERMG